VNIDSTKPIKFEDESDVNDGLHSDDESGHKRKQKRRHARKKEEIEEARNEQVCMLDIYSRMFANLAVMVARGCSSSE
jgi:hypothetical protein